MEESMTQKETTNIILELRKEGWEESKITSFLTRIESHNPTEEEVEESNRKAMNNK